MSKRPAFPLAPMRACFVASGAAAIVGTASWATIQGVSDPLAIILMTVFGGFPIASALALLAGAHLLPAMVRWLGYRWWTLAATGIAAGVAPILLAVLLQAMREFAVGPMTAPSIDPLVVGALTGIVGGLTFWLIADDEGLRGGKR